MGAKRMIELFDYQQEQVNEALDYGKMLNFSEVGTGKTYVGLELFKQSQHKKLLIICLAVKVSDFASDGSKVGLQINPLKGTPKARKALLENPSTTQVAISFESVWRTPELLNWVDKDTMILIDESHKIKSRGSKVAYFAEQLSERSGLVYLMTASPITNGHYEDYYQQLKIAKIWEDDWKEFKNQFIIEELASMKLKGGKERRFWDIVGYKNIEKLNELVYQSSVAKKRDIDNDLIPEDIFIETKLPTMYKKLLNDRVVQLDDGSINEIDSTSKMFNSLRQLCSGVLKGISKVMNKDKLNRLYQIIEENENENIVLFYNYDSELKSIKEFLKTKKIPISEYNGHKKDLSNYKNKNGTVALVHYKSGSTGLNDFIKSKICIFYSSPDSSTTYIQAKGRLNRHGQTRKPVYYHFICKGSVEYKLFYENVLEGKDLTDSIISEIVNSEY